MSVHQVCTQLYRAFLKQGSRNFEKNTINSEQLTYNLQLCIHMSLAPEMYYTLLYFILSTVIMSSFMLTYAIMLLQLFTFFPFVGCFSSLWFWLRIRTYNADPDLNADS
jgi:ABC-type multidrug transport system permease subunit